MSRVNKIFVFLWAIMSLRVGAVESIVVAPKESEVSVGERAQLRMYPGGEDVEELRVQNPLYVPWRSLNLHGTHAKTLEEILSEENGGAGESSSKLEADEES